MDVIIDIQALYGKDGDFLPKEVGVATLQDDSLGHWVVAAPYDFGELPKEIRAKNNRLTCFHHGLEWVDGDTPLQKIYENLKALCRYALRIYTRGAQKAWILQDVLGREIINLEDLGGPSFKKMPDSPIYCIHHGVSKDDSARCALNNVGRIKGWLQFQTENDANPIYTDPINPPTVQRKDRCKESPLSPEKKNNNDNKGEKGRHSKYIYEEATNIKSTVEPTVDCHTVSVEDELFGLFRSKLEIKSSRSQVSPPTPPPRRDRKRPFSHYEPTHRYSQHHEQLGGLGCPTPYPSSDERSLCSGSHTESLV